ncbi:hypothetical protein ABPG77_011021 [Micractinium sp. CCAP 211/92]
MAQFTGPSIADIPGWRIGLIFLLFCVVAISYQLGSSALDRYLRRNGKRALRHVVRRLQGELLVLGLLSLLLVAFEPYLLQICINCSGSACAWDCPAPPYGADASAGAGSGSGRRRRRLLASGAGADLGCLQAAETCAPGSEPFWSQLAIVQAHLFLFVIAVVHILYACISMLLCLWKLRRWRRYEEAAREQPLRPLRSRFLPRPGDGALAHLLRCTASMLADSVDADVYAALRRLFIERLDVHPSFNFHEFLTESMEEEFAGIVGVSSVLWCIMLLWIMLPPASYQVVWLPALAVAAGFVVAVKLQSIIICLAEDAYRLYGCSPAHAPSPNAFHRFKQRLQRLSAAFGGGSSQSLVGTVRSSNAAEPRPSPSGSAAGGNMPEPSHPLWLAPEQGSGQQQGQQTVPAGGGRLQYSHGATSLPGGSTDSSSSDGSEGDDKGQAEEGEAVASVLASAGAPPEQAAGLAATALELAQQSAAAAAASIVGCSAQAGGPGRVSGQPGEVAEQGSTEGGQESVRHQQRQVEQALGEELPCDLEAQEQPQQAARAAADAAHSAFPQSSVFRRCCPWLLPRLPWHRPRQRQRVAKAVSRSQSFSEGYRGPDAAGLFWLGKPRIALRIIQGIYFENSLSVAAVLFSLWQGINFDWGRYGGWAVLGSMIAVQLLLLAFMSIMVLPVYALTTAAGSHSAASVIQHALKKNIKPDVARALQRMSMNATAKPEDGGDHADDSMDLQHSPSAAAAAAGPEQRGGAAPAPGSDAALLAQLSPVWGPPSLARYSAPPTGSLHGLSLNGAIHPGAAGPSASTMPGVIQVQASATGAPLPHNGSLQQRPRQWPGSAASGAAGGFGSVDLVAAANAAALAPPAWDGDGEQRSITRLLGAMLQKQLQLQLERASPSTFRQDHGAPFGKLSSSNSSGHDPLGPRRAALVAPSEYRKEHEDPGSVATCPASVGAQLLRKLGAGNDGDAMHVVQAGAVGAGGSCTSVARGGAGSGFSSQSDVVINSSNGSAARPTLAQARSLFAVGAAEEAEQERGASLHVL